MSDKEYSDICIKLDAFAVEMLNLMQKIVQEHQHLDVFLKNGFADIAKSRYVMGSNSVSLLQINESDITALHKVQSENSVNNNNVQFKRFNMVEEHVESNHDAVRQRNLKKDIEELVDSTENCNISDEKQSYGGKCKEQNFDPLRWFGVLVPQSLRRAQSNFKESVFAATHIASLQNELDAILREYKSLDLRKKSLKSEQSASKSHDDLQLNNNELESTA